ncbi:MAG: peptidase dimerization domain-containing protein [Candidatus Eisenbacteria bacterium]|nr:peptidase dimerization domain-containing protein [Candidatus Eisenbacteria bacterium]
MKEAALPALDAKIAALAARYLPLAVSILEEAIRIPADFVDRPADQGGDPRCGTSNHEGPRIEYLRRTLLEIGAARSPDDVGFDAFGNLEWRLEDPAGGIPRAEKKVIYLDGHCDTVKPLREVWRAKTGGLDPFLGLVDPAKLDRAFLRRELGYLPPDDEWRHLVFGRGSADQLGGVVSQIVASKILLELMPEGALRGVVVRGYATVAEEDNDGGGPLYITRRLLPGAPPEMIPDVVILTDSSGDSKKGALGIYRGQRGRMQIEVGVTGRSCHGSMPWEGLNPLEHGGAILAEAARRYERREGFADHPFLGHGTRTASWAALETPSDCAVPDRFTFRFDRRLTVGETPEQAVKDIETLESVRAARAAGLAVAVGVPTYEEPTWRGYVPGNPQIYLGWVTPEEHPAIRAAVAAYRAVVTPHVAEQNEQGGSLRREPRVDRWVFSTDGVGFPVPAFDTSIAVPERKRWVVSGAFKHPAMFGFGTGLEQNTHKIGECLDTRELQHAIAFIARFPSAFAGR